MSSLASDATMLLGHCCYVSEELTETIGVTKLCLRRYFQTLVHHVDIYAVKESKNNSYLQQ